MQNRLEKLFTSFIALMFAASFGAVYAASPTQDVYASGDQHQDAPKDCKKNPKDPRCKDEK